MKGALEEIFFGESIMPKTSLQTSPKPNWDHGVSNQGVAFHPTWVQALQLSWTGLKVYKRSKMSLSWMGGWEQPAGRNGHLGLLWLPGMPTARPVFPGGCDHHPTPLLRLLAAPAAPRSPSPLPELSLRLSQEKCWEKVTWNQSNHSAPRAGLRAAGSDQGTWPVMLYQIRHGVRKQLPLLPDTERKGTS